MAKTTMTLIERNIATIHKTRRESDDRRRGDHRLFDRLALNLGTIRSLYAHLAVYVILLLALSVEKAAFCASLEAILLTILVLANQRRTQAIERMNSDLHLQTTLLVEHEISRIASAVAAIAEKADVDAKLVRNLDEVARDIRPDQLIEKIEEHEREVPTDLTQNPSSLEHR